MTYLQINKSYKSCINSNIINVSTFKTYTESYEVMNQQRTYMATSS